MSKHLQRFPDFCQYRDPRTGRDQRVLQLIDDIRWTNRKRSISDDTRRQLDQLGEHLRSEKIDFKTGCSEFTWIMDEEREYNPTIDLDDQLLLALNEFKNSCHDRSFENGCEQLRSALLNGEIDPERCREWFEIMRVDYYRSRYSWTE